MRNTATAEPTVPAMIAWLLRRLEVGIRAAAAAAAAPAAAVLLGVADVVWFCDGEVWFGEEMEDGAAMVAVVRVVGTGVRVVF